MGIRTWTGANLCNYRLPLLRTWTTPGPSVTPEAGASAWSGSPPSPPLPSASSPSWPWPDSSAWPWPRGAGRGLQEVGPSWGEGAKGRSPYLSRPQHPHNPGQPTVQCRPAPHQGSSGYMPTGTNLQYTPTNDSCTALNLNRHQFV